MTATLTTVLPGHGREMVDPGSYKFRLRKRNKMKLVDCESITLEIFFEIHIFDFYLTFKFAIKTLWA